MNFTHHVAVLVIRLDDLYLVDGRLDPNLVVDDLLVKLEPGVRVLNVEPLSSAVLKP